MQYMHRKKPRVVPQHDIDDYLFNTLVRSIPSNTKKITIMDLGCGDRVFEKRIKKKLSKINVKYIGIDYYNKKADILIDLNNEKIPLKNNSVDVIIFTQVMEHLYNPLFVLSEIKRVSKNNALLLIATPFLFPVHDMNHDYYRYTHFNYRHIFKQDKIVEEVISNTFLSFPLYVICYMMGSFLKNKYKYLKYLQQPFDWIALNLFENNLVTYAYYMTVGYIIKIKK